jgi:carboxylesterase type B
VNTVVETRRGKLRRRLSDGVRAFKGAFLTPHRPSARTGFELRGLFEPWAGVRDALAFGPKSPQVAYPPGIAEGIPELVSQGEDCLTLNIWTPELGAAGLPVMVWIPGPVRPRWGRVRDHRLPGGRRRLHLPA